jgi:ferredoxin
MPALGMAGEVIRFRQAGHTSAVRRWSAAREFAYAGAPMTVTVRFLPEGREVQVPRGARLISAVRRAGLPLASACGAEGLCGRCGVEIVDGSETLSPEAADEQRAKRRNRIDPRMRLACRTRVRENVTLRALYW